MKFFPPPKFHYRQIVRIKKEASNFMRGHKVLIKSLGNRSWFIGKFWYFVENLETAKMYVANEHELEELEGEK